MVRFPKVLLGLFVAVGLTIASCNGTDPTDVADPSPVEDPAAEVEVNENATSDELGESTDADEPKVEAQTDTADGASDMVAVSIYVMDDSCSNFTAESVKVPADQAMTEAVGEVLERHQFEAFKLSGYRVNVEDSKAVVDLRLAEDSQRQFLSLSSCEQQGLFGGLEETLTQNSTWKVNQVEFTNRGKEIVL
ncbi:sporulation spore germination protein [Leptolyngbya sp. Heron Island J]|uniref:sporulation spore germination protein n=1 Tax=Leptolyngbya sp. Heron Island J TaxID=1385935 RepID=UPI0003B93FED|nr:sporulation spore germination protein [Leptolyngbya sp. Heron Island J]ESA36172.1 sporulation spore germination protein [Leptolyngbya sp. Heron Island J]